MNAIKRAPQLRFPEFAGEWQEKRLGEVFDYQQPTPYIVRSTECKDTYKTPVLTAGKTFILGYTNETEGVYTNLPATLFDDFTTAVQWVDFPFKVKSSAVKILKTKAEYNPKIAHELLGRVQFKAENHQRHWISIHQNLSVYMPSLPEQQKIAAFLAAVDKRVALLERKVQQLEAYKHGVMQQLFSQQLRFTRPDGSHFPVWEKKQLGEVFLERSDRGIPGEMLSVTIANGVVPFSSIDKKDNSNPDKSKYKSVVKGDIVYNTMRMWQGASGLAVSSGICSPAYTVVIPKHGQLGLFWSYRIKNQDAINLFQRWSQGLTTDTWNLKFPVFSKLEFYCPSEEEQQKIAEFLSALDEKIALTRQQLDKTKQFKKGLLQRMFV
jgi:hypothetical protein